MSRHATRMLVVDRRREDRRDTSVLGAARWDNGVPISVAIEDVSTGGVRLRVAQKIPGGTIIRIGLPNGHAPYAKVVWSRGAYIGCQFEQPLDESELDMLKPAIERQSLWGGVFDDRAPV